MASSTPILTRCRQLGFAAAAAAIMVATGACDLPFGLDQPTTRSLEAGAAAALDSSDFEMTGGFVSAGTAGTLDLQLAKAGGERLLLSGSGAPLEAILSRDASYFRGRQFLLAHVATDARSRQLAAAAGDGWWKGLPASIPKLTDFTDGTAFRSTFLGPAADRRIDHVEVDGVPAVEFSGPRADAYLAAAPPGQPLRLRLHEGVTVDGLSAADFHYARFGQVAPITPPAGVIDFADQATLPPLYTVVSVNTSHCQSPCQVEAVVENVGGTRPPPSPATITFTLTDAVSGGTLGSCQVKIVPGVGYGSTTTLGCAIAGLADADLNAATVTATVTNPA